MTSADAAAKNSELIQELATMMADMNKNGVAITAETDFNADLNVDSVAVMDFVLMVEDEYHISIPINQLSEVQTVGEFAEVVAKAHGA